MIEIKGECEGWFSFSAYQLDADGNEVTGSRREPVPPIRNLITNGGMNRMGTHNDFMNSCSVGLGNTPPVVTNTALVSLKATVGNSGLGGGDGAMASAPYYVFSAFLYRFAAGVATGNLSEVGVGWSGGLFSRALIVDTAGTPTTITVLADEVLDVTYQLRCYQPVVDSAGTVVLDGVTYDWIGRAADVTKGDQYNWHVRRPAELQESAIAYNGPIGPITSTPTGDLSQGNGSANAGYSIDSYQRESTMTFGLTQGNVAGGIKAISYLHGIGKYQIGFTPAIPKDGTKILTLKVKTSWARKAP